MAGGVSMGPPRLYNLRAQLGQALARAVSWTEPAAEALLPSGAGVVPNQAKSATGAMYSSSVCFRLAKPLKEKPAIIAERVAEGFDSGAGANAEAAGKGFVNLTPHREVLARQVGAIAAHGLEPDSVNAPAWTRVGASKRRVLVDFSSPNLAKELHVGHLRSTVIGDALSRVLEYRGHDVRRVSHVGDWGTQFGMVLEQLKTNPDARLDTARELSQVYADAKRSFDGCEAFRARAHAQVIKLQSDTVEGNLTSETVQTWRDICRVSLDDLDSILDRLGVTVTQKGESAYAGSIRASLDDLSPQCVTSNGALCVFHGNDKPPMILQKSDGGYTYSTTDCAALRHRALVEGQDWILYVVDSGQKDHFKQLFKTGEAAGWIPKGGSHEAADVRVEHVAFGMVLGSEGKRIRTRDGGTYPLSMLVNEAEAAAMEWLRDGPHGDDERGLREAANRLGVGALKYFDLRHDRTSNYVFSPEEMLQSRGNTVVYIMYAAVRARSILKKTGHTGEEVAEWASGHCDCIGLQDPEEARLAEVLARWPEILEDVEQSLEPNKMCAYLYDAAAAFHNFHSHCRVAGSTEEKPRLALCLAASNVLEKGLDLLGIQTLERL